MNLHLRCRLGWHRWQIADGQLEAARYGWAFCQRCGAVIPSPSHPDRVFYRRTPQQPDREDD